MKKKIVSIFLCFSIIFASLMFVGCDNNYTKEDVSNLYASMKTNDDTKDLFNGNKIDIEFEGVSVAQNDKGYIFPAVYRYYVEGGGLIFSVIDRFSKMASISDPVQYVLKDFSSAQVNDIYKKLSAVQEYLKNLNEGKNIYEKTNSALHYKDLLSTYNGLISTLYDLNFSFADYYFGGMGSVDFSKADTELSDSNIRDMLWYVLLNLSKVTFNYDVVNYTPSNPLGEVKNSWIDKTEYMKSYLTLCQETLSKLNMNSDLALALLSNTNSVKNLFANIQKSLKGYEVEYQLFLKAKENFDLKTYFLATNKEAYLSNSSNLEKSNFNTIENFLNGRYKALYNALESVNTYIN